jgi:hypothetical protein
MKQAIMYTVIAAWLSLSTAAAAAAAENPQPRWWKGNLHTHSFWSDGNDFPDMIAAWYVEHGYDFLALSDHNILARGDKWVELDKNKPDREIAEAIRKYRAKFGPSWVEEQTDGDKTRVRLKPLVEYRTRFERPDEFLMIEGEEITDAYKELPVHLNASNLRELIPPQGGNSVYEVMQRNVDMVLAQRTLAGRPILVHLNHPNFRWGVTAEDLAKVRGERFFEVYNGHPGVFNYGDANHPSAERMWDIILARRLVKTDGEIMFGLATDDSHEYHEYRVGKVNPGRGWVMVRAVHLTPEAIINAMERGDFYATTGVEISQIKRTSHSLSFTIANEPGVTYKTQFIGTELQHDGNSEPRLDADGKPAYITRRYSKDIGKVLAETDSTRPSYTFTGREIYVRATVVSSRPHPNGFAKDDLETAWIQPVIPPR